ncbi:hypothetical protein BC830DRAFT_605896 [Chytriomyces sp. MP71]|nr:hypothetical protein BC830DRAFT_605896 [Chytriomyces sp. MP71]
MLGCTLTARISGLDWRESSTVGILMNTRGLVQIIVLNVGLNAGVITPQIFSMFVLMAVFTTFLTVPLVSAVYPKSYYSGELNAALAKDVEEAMSLAVAAESSEIPEVNDDSQLRALVCLPSMNVVLPMMTLCTMVSGSPQLSAFTVFALRLVKLDSRLSTVMQAAEHSDTVKEDPILSVFRTFGSLHGLNSFPMLQFSNPAGVAGAIVDAAKQASANLIIVPQSAAKNVSTPTTPASGALTSKYQSSWIGEDSTQQMRRVVTEVKESLNSVSVVHFIDRGFMSLNNRAAEAPSVTLPAQSIFRNSAVLEPSPLTGKAEVSEKGVRRPKPPRLNSTHFQSRITIVVIVKSNDDADDLESLRLVQHITGSPSVSTTVTFDTHIVRLFQGTKSSNSIDTLEDGGIASATLLPHATHIQMDTDDMASLTSRLGVLVKHHEDLVVVGESALKVDEGEHYIDGQKQVFIGLEHWLEYDCSASVAIVHGRK